jgi:peroxiredoxin
MMNVRSALSTRHLRLPRWAWVGLVLAVVAAFVIGVDSGSGSSSNGGSGTVVAPAWSGAALNGTTLDSSDERGRWVVLNFFATWCGDCVAETPQLARFATANPTSRVQVVGVIYTDPVSDVRSFAKSHDVTWPLLSDPGNRISSAYRVVALPESFVIRPDGTLAKRVYGGVTAAALQKIIDS